MIAPHISAGGESLERLERRGGEEAADLFVMR
jgi:hypothetical protein